MVLEQCEIRYAKIDPERPDDHFSKTNPEWSVQLYTEDRKQAKQWREAGLKVKAVEHEDDEGNVSHTSYTASLRRKVFGKGDKRRSPVRCINGAMQDLDPRSIGNGSIANVSIFQYESTNSETGAKMLVSMLSGLQVTKHIVYKPKERKDEFSQAAYEAVLPPGEDTDFGSLDDEVPF